MFKRNNISKLEVDNFGAGSIIHFDSDENYLVVYEKNGEVRLINLSTFMIEENSIKVGDYNYLTIEEAGEMSYLTKKPYTRSDWDYIPEGLKEYDYSRAKL